ncbi:MAG: hypothetical protein CMA41_04670 [Euryarchaeota archaeon]|nr:hypothetical protein [Euryarchaeota archaeon]MBF14431.1 hypothetical protein [Euryarchaeota archaeon]MDP6865919.1 hypothetical protein [Candidatus Poseidoniaceae archaeon]CAI8337994.1 MAG: Uncharacterised protein [Euryarchaeota archaeon UBA443]
MAFCVTCGQSLHDGMRFCRFCGNQQPGEQLIQRLRMEAEQIRQIALMMSNQQAQQAAQMQHQQQFNQQFGQQRRW